MGIFSDLKPRNKANRNGFDLSRRTVFSNKPGVIRPCLALPTLPSSEYEIDMAQLMRTQPLQTAAFTGASLNYDFIFVPYNHLYSSFNQFIAQREDAEHVGQPDYMEIPSFVLSYYLRKLLPYAALDYILSGVTDEQWQSSKYNGALADFYLDEVPHYFFLSNNNATYSLVLSSVSMLDMLGYGNFLPVVKMIAQAYIGYFDAKVAEGTWDPVPFGVDKRLWYVFTGVANEEIYDIPEIIMNYTDTYLIRTFGFRWNDYWQSFNQNYTFWPALAYNKCFYNYYRNTYYDERYSIQYIQEIDTSSTTTTVVEFMLNDYVKLFNCDDLPDFSGFGTLELFCRFLGIMSEKLHLYKRDMFTGVLPSTQFGSVSSMATDSDVLRIHNLYFNALQDSDKKQAVIKANTQNVTTLSGTSSTQLSHVTIEPALAISVLEARKADAMQRFKERMLRAGNKTKDIFESHGWSRPKSQSAFEPVFLGSYDGSIDINVVAATTETDSIELGQLGANGVSVVRGNKIHVKTSDFGVILCLQYIVKSAEYDAYGVEKQHTLLEPFDFPYPELQNISLVPITQNILNHVSPVPYSQAPDVTAAQKVLGFLPRSFEFKTAVDKVHGEFYGSSFMWYGEVGEGYGNTGDIAPLGVFSDWVTTRKQTYLPASSWLSFHYIQIDCFDNIFKQRCTSDPSTDPFLFNVQFDIKAVEPLPVIGLPM